MTGSAVPVWTLYRSITRRLLAWSGGSVLVGALFILLGGQMWRAAGIQCVAWGAVDGIIAVVGNRISERRRLALGERPEKGALERELVRLRRLLWINAGLDILYVTAGLVLAIWLGSSNQVWRGHGWGIVVQGAFLLVFDVAHGRAAGRLLL